MKEVVVQSWCDGEHAMKQPATHANQEVTLRAGKRFTVDLYESCFSTLVKPLETIVHEHGTPITMAAPTKKSQTRHGKGPEVCNKCGFGARNESGLNLHAMRKHGLKLADVKQEAATV